MTADALETAPAFDERFCDDLDSLLRWRRDVRHFRSDPIPEPLLSALLAQADLAPSVGNAQPWRFVRVVSPEARRIVRDSFERCNRAALDGYGDDRAMLYARLKLQGLDQAPEHLAVFGEPEPDQGHGLGRQTMPETTAYSCVMAIHTLWLVARARGVGLGWVSILDPEHVARALGVPCRWRLIGYLCLGYPAGAHAVPELERTGWQARTPTAQRILEV